MSMLPVGKKDNFNVVRVNRGDKLKLITGETVTFEVMKRTRFSVMSDKGRMSVPVYRTRNQSTPFIVEVVGHDTKAVPKKVVVGTLIPGNLFKIEGKRGTYMFERKTKKNIHGWDISTRQSYNISKTFNIVQLHMDTIYKELVG